MSVNKVLARVLPPVVVQLARRWRPRQPMFTGVHASRPDVADDDPWESDARMAFAERELGDAIEASSRRQPVVGSELIACLVINLLSSSTGRCKVLDFGGGTGNIYFRLRSELTHRASVEWIVVDNPRVSAIGQRYRNGDDNLSFCKAIPNQRDVDVVLVSGSLQYVADWKSELAALIETGPSHVILTRLVAGNVATYFSCQNVPGGKAPSLFLNEHELTEFFDLRGFDLMHASYAPEDGFGPWHYEGVPASAQIGHTRNLVFTTRGRG